MEINTKIKICSGVLAAVLMPAYASAAYATSSDTGVEILDYIENNRRAERENRLTEEQQQLLKDTAVMKAHLPEKLDPAKKEMPVGIEGDDLVYNQRTGAVYANGNVRITSLDQRRFTTQAAEGNLKSKDIAIEDKSHMLQMTPGQQRITLDGYKTKYNYGSASGQMEDVSGKVDHQYITAKRIELYPDMVILYDGTATKCAAKHPDYHISAKKIEIYKAKNLMVLYDVKYWLGKMVLYTEKRSEQDLNKKNGQRWPRAGYDNDDGFWVKQRYDHALARNVNAYFDMHYMTKKQFKNVLGVEWGNAGNSASIKYGYFEDGNNNWIKKEPTLTYGYGHRIGKLPWSYGLSYEIGRWYQNGIHSTHSYYGLSLGRDAILFNGWQLYLSTGYSITKESYNRSNVKGFSYDATLLKNFNDRWAGFAGYHYTHNNSNNSLFNYNLDDYSRKFETGLSYRFSDKDRLVAGLNYDMDGKTLKDVDYFWYHDIHCAEVILRYRAKRQQWHIGFQFIPW